MSTAPQKSAFTLIELLIVILIIAILIAIAVPSFLNQQNKAKDSAAEQTLTVVGLDTKSAFTSAQATNNGTYPALQALITSLAQSEPQYQFSNYDTALTGVTMGLAGSGQTNDQLTGPSTGPNAVSVTEQDANGDLVDGTGNNLAGGNGPAVAVTLCILSASATSFCQIREDEGGLITADLSSDGSGLLGFLSPAQADAATTGSSYNDSIPVTSTVASAELAARCRMPDAKHSFASTASSPFLAGVSCSTDTQLGNVVSGWSAGNGTTTVASVPTSSTTSTTTSTTSSATVQAVTPTISGQAQNGQVLTVAPSGYSYQWQDCTTSSGTGCSNIVSATSATYTLATSDVGNYVRVILTNNGTSTPSNTTALVTNPVYGQTTFTSGTANNGGVSANSLSTPMGLTFDSSGGLYVADQANNRVLYYPAHSTTATRVYGQASFTSNAANAGGVSASSLDNPSGVAVTSSGGLYVSDQTNNRVLYYPPSCASVSAGCAATQVYGQTNFTSNSANTGGVSGSSLHTPTGISLDSSGGLYVTDQDNNRILYFPASCSTNDCSATRVLGQTTFTNSGPGSASATGLDTPRDVTAAPDGGVYVADWAYYRWLYYPASCSSTATDCAATRVYGSGNGTTNGSLNADNPGTTATNNEWSFYLTIDSSGGLYMVDGAIDRVLYYASPTQSAPSGLYGQTSYTASGAGTSQTQLSEPWGAAIAPNGDLYVADAGNNRIIVFPGQASSSTAIAAP